MRPWQKGQPSPNPRGNWKKTKPLKSLLIKGLKACVGDKLEAELMVAGMIRAAMKGNSGCAKIIFDHVDGPPPTVHEGGDPEKPIQLRHTDERTESATREYLRSIAGGGVSESGGPGVSE